MNCRFRQAALVLATAGILLPCLAYAQPGGGRGFRGFGGANGGGILGLAQRDEVQQEIGLLDEQQEQLTAITDEFSQRIRDEFRGAFAQLGDVSDEERRARFDEIRAGMETMLKETEGKIEKVLMPHQFQRLKQIDLQTRIQQGGVAALTGDELVEALGLTSRQQDQLRERSEEVQQEMQDQIQQLQLDARNKLLEVLTPEQRAKLQSMMGEDFSLPNTGRGGRGGRGGRANRTPNQAI
jgi:Spy/CpxP family protein refolding chaperone